MDKADLIRRSIKILDIGYATVIYFFLAIWTVPLLDRILGKYNAVEESKKSTNKIIIEIVLRVWCIGVISYLARNLVPLIPFPLQGVYGFDHSRVKEVTSGVIFASYLATFDIVLQSKVGHLRTRLFGAVNSSVTVVTPIVSAAQMSKN